VAARRQASNSAKLLGDKVDERSDDAVELVVRRAILIDVTRDHRDLQQASVSRAEPSALW